MRITKYTVELNGNCHNVLVKEKAFNYSEDKFTSPKVVKEMLCSVFSLDKKAEEYVYMLSLNTKGKLLGVFEISHGAVNTSRANPREIFIRAILTGASNIILIHNHPSGDSTPSREDLIITKRIDDCCKLINIPLLDHIIIGNDNYYSMMESDVMRINC